MCNSFLALSQEKEERKANITFFVLSLLFCLVGKPWDTSLLWFLFGLIVGLAILLIVIKRGERKLQHIIILFFPVLIFLSVSCKPNAFMKAELLFAMVIMRKGVKILEI